METETENYQMTNSERKKLIIQILQDSVIWHNVSAGLMAVNAAYSPEFNNQYGFEPEEQYHGYTKAYMLMGVDDEMSMLLYTLFNAAVDKNNSRPDDRKANAQQLAEEIYMDWALAVCGKKELSTV